MLTNLAAYVRIETIELLEWPFDAQFDEGAARYSSRPWTEASTLVYDCGAQDFRARKSHGESERKSGRGMT
jgi:hypothetical protein